MKLARCPAALTGGLVMARKRLPREGGGRAGCRHGGRTSLGRGRCAGSPIGPCALSAKRLSRPPPHPAHPPAPLDRVAGLLVGTRLAFRACDCPSSMSVYCPGACSSVAAAAERGAFQNTPSVQQQRLGAGRPLPPAAARQRVAPRVTPCRVPSRFRSGQSGGKAR